MIGQCTICIAEESDYIANKVAKKDLTHEEAARELGVKVDEWIAHYELHVRRRLVNAIATDIESIKDQLIDKIQEGQKSIRRVINVTDGIYKRLSENEDVQKDVKLIQAYASLEKNLMSGLKELAILEGDISAATTVNHYHNAIKVDKLMAVVMEDAPPEFKNKLLKKLNELDFTTDGK